MLHRSLARILAGIAMLIAAGRAAPAAAQVPGGTTLEQVIPPGENFDKAEFRLWLPAGAAPVRGVVVLMPGSNGDGRSEVSDTVWQQFAVRNQLALVGCRLTDKPHDQGFIEDYVNVSHGSGQALLDALTAFAASARHPEIAAAPLLLWGMSAGGEFNYEFVNWKPERVASFVVNKGGIYYTALASRAARSVPGILFIGGKDLESRVEVITGLWAVNRRGGALWALAEEPGAAHIVGRSRDVAMALFEDVLVLRFDAEHPTVLKPVTEQSGLLGDLKSKAFQPVGSTRPATEGTAWLPTERVARAWQAMMTDKPFEGKP
jgi:poly(3-hydroxybutyrate) depolymerase